MKRSILTGFSFLTLNVVLVVTPTVAVAVSNHSLISEQNTTTFDTRVQESIAPEEKSGGKPPSGDSNPSDLTNSTVDDRDIIDPLPN